MKNLIVMISIFLLSFNISASEPIDTREVVVPTVVTVGTAGSIAAFTGSIITAGFLVSGALGVLIGDGIYRSGLGEKLGTTQLGKKLGSKLHRFVSSINEEPRDSVKEFSSNTSLDKIDKSTYVLKQ